LFLGPSTVDEDFKLGFDTPKPRPRITSPPDFIPEPMGGGGAGPDDLDDKEEVTCGDGSHSESRNDPDPVGSSMPNMDARIELPELELLPRLRKLPLVRPVVELKTDPLSVVPPINVLPPPITPLLLPLIG
jgi:hypothetical protein